MSRNSDYKNLKALAKSLSNGVAKLESGKLNSKELTDLLDDARTLHERITVLQYLAFDKEVKKEEIKKPKKETKKSPQGSFELNFGTPQKVEELKIDPVEGDVHPNQINLLDAIDEHVDEDEEVEVGSKEEVAPVEKEVIPDSEAVKSINEKFAEEASEKTLAHKLSRQPISNLKEAIGLNQKFLFMNDLFQGENGFFNDAIEAINNFDDLEQAMEYIDANLSSNYNWDKAHKSVMNFIDLVERRFMA